MTNLKIYTTIYIFRIHFWYILAHYNYLQLLCREIIELLIYRGFPRPFCRTNWSSEPEVKLRFYFSEKVVLSSSGIPIKRRLKIRNYIMKNSRNFQAQRVVISLIFPTGQISKITTHWRHQIEIKEREIKADNFFYQNAVKYKSAPHTRKSESTRIKRSKNNWLKLFLIAKFPETNFY